MNRALLLVPVLLIAGCGKGGFSKRASDRQADAFRYSLPDNPTTLDPAKVQDVDTIDLLQNVFEGLVAYDEHNQIVPQLASGWVVGKGGRSYLFTLRDAKFANGRAVDAEDVKRSIERSLNPAFQSPTASSYLSDIVGAKDYAAGKTSAVAGLRVVDPKTIEVAIDKPRPYFLGELTYPCAFVVPKETGLKEIGTATAIGTGPFRIEAVHPGQSVVLTANADYYLGAPKLTRIERPIVKDPETRLNKYREGSLDYLSLARQDLPAVEADPVLRKQLYYVPRPTFFYLGANPLRYPPFRDRRVRRAMAMAIDKEKLANDVLGGVPPARGIVPPGVPGFRADAHSLPFDPAAARKELADAGYPGGKGLPPLTITIRSDAADARLAAEAIAGDLRKHLGWPTTIRSMEFRALFEARNAKKLECYHGSWSADYFDPQNFLSMILSGDTSLNFDSYRNPDFDQLCSQADVEQNDTKRLAIYAKAEDIALQDAARIPLYTVRDAILVNPRVRNLRTNLSGLLPHRTTTVDE